VSVDVRSVDVNGLPAPVLTGVVGQPVNDGPIEVQGTSHVLTISAGDTITFYHGATGAGAGVVDGSGTFDITTFLNFPDSIYDITATETKGSLTSAPSTPLLVPVGPTTQNDLYYSQIYRERGPVQR
jgi:hypothetical protein